MSVTAAVIATKVGEGAASRAGGMVLEGVLAENFGGPAEIIERLARIEKLLEEISLKLEYLIELVEEIPELVSQVVNVTDLDRRWAYIEADYDNYQDELGDGEEPTESVANELRHAWLVLVDYELRPKKLAELPFWTEYIRSRLSIKRGPETALFEDIQEKVEELRDCIEEAKDRFDENLKLATSLFAKKYNRAGVSDKANGKKFISSSEVSDKSPFISWKPRRDVTVKKSRGLFKGSTKKTHRRFKNQKNGVDRRLKKLKVELVRDYQIFASLIPILALFERYEDWLGRSN